MKNIGLIVILLLGINSIGFTQKTQKNGNLTITKATYVLTGDKGSVLLSLDEFKKHKKYSSIEKSLVLGILMEKNDTVIKYILLDQKNRPHYHSLSNERSRKLFLKKYGAIYKVKRQTPVLN